MLHLQQTMQTNQQRPRTLSSPTKHSQSILISSDIVQCYICFSTIEIQSNIRTLSSSILCADCHRPVCYRCGNYTSPEFIQPHNEINLENQTHASKWRCRMCIVRREVIRKSGTCLNIKYKTELFVLSYWLKTFSIHEYIRTCNKIRGEKKKKRKKGSSQN
jgi:hypothetical protein